MRFLSRSLIGLFLLSATAGLLGLAGLTLQSALQDRAARESRQPPQRERVFAANVIALEPQSVTPILTAFGEVRSTRTLELRAPIGGPVVEVHPTFQEGGRVSAGTVLIRIDPADVETVRDKARTDLDEALADLEDARVTARLAADELIAAQDQATLRQQALARQQNLLERGVGTEAAVEVAALAAAAADQALINQRQSQAQANAQIASSETGVARRQIELREAERNLADTRVVAEFDGTLADTAVVRGGLLSANEQIAQLIDPDALEVAFRVSAGQYLRLVDDLGALAPLRIEVALDAFGVELTTGATISRESGSVGEGQTGRRLFAHLDDPAGFRPGDFVTVRVSEPALDGVALIPASAVGPTGDVLVLGTDDRLEVMSVDVLRRQENEVIIRAGGAFGREIIAERTPVLGAGIKIRPIRPGTQPTEAAELLELDDDRRARLIAFVEANQRMPEDAKARILTQLNADKVPARMVERLEGRMGG